MNRHCLKCQKSAVYPPLDITPLNPGSKKYPTYCKECATCPECKKKPKAFKRTYKDVTYLDPTCGVLCQRVLDQKSSTRSSLPDQTHKAPRNEKKTTLFGPKSPRKKCDEDGCRRIATYPRADPRYCETHSGCRACPKNNRQTIVYAASDEGRYCEDHKYCVVCRTLKSENSWFLSCAKRACRDQYLIRTREERVDIDKKFRERILLQLPIRPVPCSFSGFNGCENETLYLSTWCEVHSKCGACGVGSKVDDEIVCVVCLDKWK